MKSNRIIPTREIIDLELESDDRIKALWLKLNEDEVRFVCKARDFYNKTFVKELQKNIFSNETTYAHIEVSNDMFIPILFKYFPNIELNIKHFSGSVPIYKFKDILNRVDPLEAVIDYFDSESWTKLCIELLTQGFHPNSFGRKTF